MIKIALIGATGSIGSQVASVVRRYPERFQLTALVSFSRSEELSRLAYEFCPSFVGLVSEGELHLPDGVKRLSGEDILAHVFDGADVALVAAGGFAGLSYTLRAAELGKKIALANKESLVCGGELVMKLVEEKGLDLSPIDSEHSALWQALGFNRHADFEKLVLTASGGPFRKYSRLELERVTAKDALKHPTWDMGNKITIDSATLLNKGYEVIEAKWLYGADFSKIEAVVHPESIVHSLVLMKDGSMMAQMGYPTMELPIQLALTYPERFPCEKPLDLVELGALHFERLRSEDFPCFTLAVEAGKTGGTAPTLLNGAGEEAVYAFLKGRISFLQIADTIKETLDRIPVGQVENFERLQEADELARKTARNFISHL